MSDSKKTQYAAQRDFLLKAECFVIEGCHSYLIALPSVNLVVIYQKDYLDSQNTCGRIVFLRYIDTSLKKAI